MYQQNQHFNKLNIIKTNIMNIQQNELNKIKTLINSCVYASIEMEVGLVGSILQYETKKEFGNRVLEAYANGRQVIFKSLKNGIITFKEITESRILTESEQRGYGLGNYQGD